jgi:hypothetical protein
MRTVDIYVDELYPYYGINLKHERANVEITETFYKRYLRVKETFEKMQEELATLYEKANA